MDSLLSSIIYVLIIGGIAGYFIGYMIKKISNFAPIIGIFVFLLIFMGYTKTIDLNFDELGAIVTKFSDALAPLGLIALVSSAPFVGSFVVGLFFGLKRVH